MPSTNNRKVLTKVDPGYPALARKNGIIGTVKLRVVIAADGRAKTVDIMGGNPVLANPAKDSVLKWKWSPADHDSSEVIEVRFDSRT